MQIRQVLERTKGEKRHLSGAEDLWSEIDNLKPFRAGAGGKEERAEGEDTHAAAILNRDQLIYSGCHIHKGRERDRKMGRFG